MSLTKIEAGAIKPGAIAKSDLAIDVYTKTETDTALGLKANQNTTYTKTETDTALGLKANTSSLGTLAGKNTVASNDIDNASVTTNKIADNNVTAAKIAVGAYAERFQYARLPVTGNISANTWYTLCDTGVLGGQGIGHISAYSSTVGYGGDHYDLILDGGSLPLKDRSTNDAYTSATYDFAKMAGHAPNGQRFYWRIRFQGGNPRSALIEWQSTSAMSGLTDGVLVFYIHAIARF